MLNMLTPQEAAKRLGVSASLIYQLCRELVLKHYRLGGKGKRGRIRIDAEEIERFRAVCCRDGLSVLPPLKHLTMPGTT